ncbi:nuclear transport factor 2 family protein [Winogradskyella forsetii]|uniref:nuclear transport factor 2 family protein n=1 Tax=Winogradskyella forsetii TaxID=2686077 RepID=UPI0015BB8DE9|nr:nuclear transport factor 2 family protein [Winogradskyella forsetii]
MKTKFEILIIMIFGCLIINCKQQEEKTEVKEVKVDLLNDEFPNAQLEVKLTMDSIAQSVKERDLDRLISFHAYSPKYTEFKNGELRIGGEENERFERIIFEEITEVVKFDFSDMKIAIYDNLANVTAHTDFHLKFGEELAIVNEQMTMLLLKTKEGWRIVHEHRSLKF